MQLEIFSNKQLELLPFISQFRRGFYLVGGTAVALYIGHRRSIDFDLFTEKKLNRSRLKQKVFGLPYHKHILYDDIDQIHFFINEVKITFFHYPYPLEHICMLENIISMPSLLSLAAMKAYALGRRAKWKDYVDLYFIINGYFSIEDISMEAKGIFGQLFSEKLFREQLAFHKDIDYAEQIEFMPGFKVPDKKIKDFLIDASLQVI
ncbi:MAG: nucleotidyl transferase AbiEii/AbiGii toxin family protein [Treponema sp.]|nr:nucleotidyl transferase AbiEii/AbiGii toxin family protein [Treponema sp.]